MEQNFTVEELKTAVGGLMLDLRGNWRTEYVERMELVVFMLQNLINLDKANKSEYEYDLNMTLQEMENPYDGRVFTGSYLYGYSSDEGKTQRVRDYLENTMTHPEYNLFDLEN
jgi:hypothetical protein